MFFEESYLMLALALLISAVFAYLGYRYRDSLYRWIEKQNKS